MKTALKNILLQTLFKIVNNTVQHCWAWISLQSGVTMLINIVTILNNVGNKTLFNATFSAYIVLFFCAYKT